MAGSQINEKAFIDLVLAAFPQLTDDFRYWSDLDGLQMMEFRIFTLDAADKDDWATVARCLALADTLLERGDATVKNLVYVSYLEHFPRQGEIHDRLRQMMTTELRQGWDDILAYLRKLLADENF